MKLSSWQFIKSAILFEGKPAYQPPMKVGVEVTLNGFLYQALHKTDAGWEWRRISGRDPGEKVFFEFGHKVYTLPRVYPTKTATLTTDSNPRVSARSSKDKIVNIPEELKDPLKAYEYAKWTLNGPWPDGEYYIAKLPRAVYLYANSVLHGRFWKGEDILRTRIDWACKYAIDVMKERWPEIEPELKTYPSLVHEYCTAFKLIYDPTSNTYKDRIS